MTHTYNGITIRVTQDPRDDAYFKVFCPCCKTHIGAVWASLNGWGANLWSLSSAELSTQEEALNWICRTISETGA
jgi:hypothetical protein